MEQEKNNQKLSKELNSLEDISITKKIYNFYFFTLRKKDINLFFYTILFILEILQLISYSFSDPHLNNWNIKESKMNKIKLYIGAVRITPLMKYIKDNIYMLIFIILCVYIFLYFLLLTMLIKFNKTNSKMYQIGIIFTRYSTAFMTIFFFIPLIELLLLPFKCVEENNQLIVDILKKSINCWEGLHYLYCVVGVFFSLLFYILVNVGTIFYFNPFNSNKSTTKISSNSDTFLYFSKVLLVIKFIWIKDEYISVVLMLILAFLNIINEFQNPTYSNNFLECLLSIRNCLFFWTNFCLLINKFTGKNLDGNIYLYLFGFPLIICFSIIYFKYNSAVFYLTIANLNNANDFILKSNQLVYLINDFFERNKRGNKANKGNFGMRNEILLKGCIQIHEENCIDEECPLKKFIDEHSNFTVQKTSLLHYMNNYFTSGIKKFPNNRILLLSFINFNYENKYNLNSAKTFLSKLEKTKNSLTEDFIIHCIKQNISSSNNKANELNEINDILKVEDSTEQKYQRLKYLVETSTKLYGEFWGILAANLTNKLNLTKLFIIGNKLNKFLNEINSLWENDLKNKKIDLENQSIAQLYVFFLREILRNKKRSEEITKKINEEQHYESRKIDDDKFDINNLDILLENQDYVMYCRTNEKGECNIIQTSNSIVHLLGFLKQDLIGNNIETLMPSIYVKDHAKMLSNRLKQFHNKVISHKDNYRTQDKKQIFLLPKTKIGYLIPLNSRFSIYNDDDFSNTYIIKAKFESKDTKSVYAFYVLTKDDFTVDSISSSAINLGLSMDLLKKYVINMNVLVRSENNLDSIALNEKFTEYEEEPKKVTWVMPDIIYPKNDNQRNKEEDINELIKKSRTKEFMLIISRTKFNDDEILGFCFRFTEVDNKKGNIDPNEFHQNSTKHILFNLMNLNYIRTVLVDKKKGKNLVQINRLLTTNNENEITENLRESIIKKTETKKKKKKSKEKVEKEKESSEENSDNEKKIENLLTKEKIIEMQSKLSNEVKSFIFTLPFWGNEVSLEKHRPNKEKYPVGKAQEPLIKINISTFIKRIDEKLKNHPDLKKRLEAQKAAAQASINQNSNENNSTTEQTISNTNNNISTNNVDNNTPGLNNEFSSDTSASLSNIFNEKSVFYITIFSLITFLLIIFIITIEFIMGLNKINNSKDRIGYLNRGFILLNDLVYTKFFITEALFGKNDGYVNRDTNEMTVEEYVNLMKKEMSIYREEFSNTWAYFSNATVTFSNDYNYYIENTQVTIKTISNEIETTESQPFSIAMSRIPTSVFYVSTVTDDLNSISMNDRNTYELMQNLLNDYFINWKNIIILLVEDIKNNTKKSKIVVFVFVCSLLIAIAALIIFWKLIKRFINDREKPIDLFLTIKKKKFEELKNSSESFVNKLLNKFFGNEENEEESMKDYSTNIKPDDINIVKFKTKIEYKNSMQSSGEYLINYIKLLIFFIIIECYMGFKLLYYYYYMNNMSKFTDIYNLTQYCQSDIILSLDIMKSYLFNRSIPILNENDTHNLLHYRMVNLTDSFEDLFRISYNTSTFLKNNYMESFYDLINNNISEYIYNEYNDDISTLYLGTLRNGFKAVLVRFFELLRYIATNLYNNNTNIEDLYNFPEFREINSIAKNVIRPWYKNLIELMNKDFKNFINKIKVVNISTYIVLLCVVVVLYCLVWRSYEDNLKHLLKTSVDLINLIPEEIKYQIVLQLNEEENKNE